MTDTGYERAPEDRVIFAARSFFEALRTIKNNPDPRVLEAIDKYQAAGEAALQEGQ